MIKGLHTWICFIALFLTFSQTTVFYATIAKGEQVSVRRINNSDGLSHFNVRDAIEDELGRIWFATASGINIYDGYDFIIKRHEHENTNSLSSSDIRTLLRDSKNHIWIGTLGGGINRYIAETDSFKHYKIEGAEGHSPHEVYTFFEDKSGNLWAGTHEGLALYDKYKDKFSIVKTQVTTENILSNDAIKAIAQTDKDKLWLGFANTGLCEYSIIDKSCKLYQRFVAIQGSLTSNQISALHVDHNQTLWVGTSDKGINLLKYSEEKFENFEFDYLKDQQDSSVNTQTPNDKEITSFAEDSQGNIWIGTNNGGLNHYDIAVDEFKFYTSSAADHHTLSSNSVSFVYIDSNDRIWVGSPDSGVSTLSAYGTDFAHYRHDPLLGLGPVDNIINSFAETSDGSIWIGSRKGINRFIPWTEEFRPFLKDENKHLKKENRLNNVSSLLSDDTSLWIGTKKQGLYRYSLIENTLDNWNSVFHNGKLKEFRNISLLHKDRKNRIWIADNNGLTWLDSFQGVLKPVELSPSKLFKTTERIKVTSFFENRSQILWIGTSENLYQYDLNTKKFKVVKFQGFKFPYVNAMYEDDLNNYWLATNTGLYHIDYNTQKIEHFDDRHDFPSAQLFSLLPDTQDNLWITTNDGLVRFNKTTKKVDVFTSHDGLQSNGFNKGSYLKTNSGILYIGGVNGFNRFDPRKIEDQSQSRTLLSGKVTSRDGNVRTMKVGEENINLSYSHDRVEFTFTPIHFKNPAGNRFSYRLFNYDTVWQNGVARNDSRVVAYENLPPGNYVFTLRTSANVGVWSTPVSIKFNIALPFWQTWWAYLLYCVAAIALIAAIIRWRSEQLRRKAKALKREVESKTQEIIFKNQELEELLDFRSRFYRRAAHELRTPLTLVQLPLQEYVNDKINVEGKEYEPQKVSGLIMVLRNIQRLKRITDQMLSYSKDPRQTTRDMQIIDLQSTLVPILELAEKNATEKGIRFYNDDIPKAAVTLDRDALEDIVLNLLSNAIKYTNAGGTVMFNLFLNDKTLNFEVHDTGVGIAKTELETVFKPFFRGIAVSNDNNGFGVGLSVVKEKIEASGSEIAVHSIKDEGTEFTVSMPILVPSIDELTELPENLNAVEYWPSKETGTALASLLVVEDDPDMCILLRSILSTEFKVDIVNNCKEAKASIVEKTYDCILTDALLPDGNGFELLEYFRTQAEVAHLPIIMLTALAEKSHLERALDLGADDYIIKPFSSTELMLRIKSHVSNRDKVGEWWRQQLQSDYTDIEGKPEPLTTQRALSQKDTAFLEVLRSFLEKEMGHSDLTLPIAAKGVAVSERQIQRKLKTLLGSTFTEYLTEIRMRKAVVLLQAGFSVKEVSSKVGYSDPSHFATLFKDRFGVTPSKYKSGELENYADTG